MVTMALVVAAARAVFLRAQPCNPLVPLRRQLVVVVAERCLVAAMAAMAATLPSLAKPLSAVAVVVADFLLAVLAVLVAVAAHLTLPEPLRQS